MGTNTTAPLHTFKKQRKQKDDRSAAIAADGIMENSNSRENWLSQFV